ncbi:hypothetical protein K438DRAFT_1844702 [Mycena galopus ATCC 62051]|nr:hypothetical protein K438DRAFT_1844702 [Mycena galopus ATCC 62051]
MLMDLEADRTLVARIQARILDLECSLAELRAEQAVAQQRLDSYKYPVLTLPNEITSEIFIHFLPPYPICPPVVGMFSPTHLTHICRRWREIALATPALWRAIGPSNPDLDSDIDVSKISDAWVNRSGSCPLSIEINEDDTLDDPLSTLSTLIPHRARWEYLALFLNENSEDSLHRIEGPMPLLRHLQLSLLDHDLFEMRDVPQLRSVVLENTIDLTLPWTQLTSLTLRWVGSTVCIPILQQTTRLVHCVLELFRIYPLQSTGINITLPCLKSLTLISHFDDEEATTEFLATLIVPVLHRLEVHGRILGRNRIHSLASFIATSGCKVLQEIHITGRWNRQSTVSDDDYRAAFPSIPTISFESKSIPDGRHP